MLSHPPGTHCVKCDAELAANRMSIEIWEDPLPEDALEAKCVVFELSCEAAFAAYRETTWSIIGGLARSGTYTNLSPPKLTLSGYLPLKQFQTGTSTSFTLASPKKSFLSTHYKTVWFSRSPGSESDVFVPHGPRYYYFDTETRLWPNKDRFFKTFSHHVQFDIPKESKLSCLQPKFEVGVKSSLSSYSIIASQGSCPIDTNVQEFMDYQLLATGTYRRWPDILLQLGSSSLNLGDRAISSLIIYCATQAGPMNGHGPLRAAHAIFQDKSFCHQLLQQLDQRLALIENNWREVCCLNLVLTLNLRLSTLAVDTEISSKANDLLGRIREITFSWINQLRVEAENAADEKTSQRLTEYHSPGRSHVPQVFCYSRPFQATRK